ncbi:MAG: alpha/beta fold hydrolase [Planctomycetota bacterium]
MNDRQHFFLIHGWNMPTTSWNSVNEELENRKVNCEVTVAELPGYGNSNATDDTPDAALGGSDGTDLIESQIESLLAQAPPCSHWCGWSLGATLAMIAAANRRANIKRLMLISPTPCFTIRHDWAHGMDQRVFEKLFRITQKDQQRGWRRFLELQTPADWDAEQRQTMVERWMTDDANFAPAIAALQQGMDVLCQTDLRPLVPAINIPSQVLASPSDRIVPVEASRWIANTIPNAVYEEHAGGHALPIAAANVIVDMLTSWTQEPQTSIPELSRNSSTQEST